MNRCKHGYDAQLCPYTHDGGRLDPLSKMYAPGPRSTELSRGFTAELPVPEAQEIAATVEEAPREARKVKR